MTEYPKVCCLVCGIPGAIRPTFGRSESLLLQAWLASESFLANYHWQFSLRPFWTSVRIPPEPAKLKILDKLGLINWQSVVEETRIKLVASLE